MAQTKKQQNKQKTNKHTNETNKKETKASKPLSALCTKSAVPCFVNSLEKGIDH